MLDMPMLPATVPESSLPGDSALRAARSWFGYGRWEAPCWFLGLEQGGSEGPLQESFAAWARLGGGELLDCRAHHLAIADPRFRRWHEAEAPPTQPTWRRLIQLLLAYQGRDTGLDAVRAYQRECWGSAEGETAVLELLGVRAQGLATKADRVSFREERIARLRGKLDAHRPMFVVCYGISAREDFGRLFDFPFDRAGYTGRGSTLGVLAPHPVSRHAGDAEAWTARGREIARLVTWMPDQGVAAG